MTTYTAQKPPAVQSTVHASAVAPTNGGFDIYSAYSRLDLVNTTSGSSTVADTSITAADNGLPVTGTGIPANSFVGTVTAGTSFLLSSSPSSQVNVNATATGTGVSATIGAGAVAPVLPALSSGLASTSAQFTIEKDAQDATVNPVTVTCAGADTFKGGASTLALTTPGERVVLQAATVAGTLVWKSLQHTLPPSAGRFMLGVAAADLVKSRTGGYDAVRQRYNGKAGSRRRWRAKRGFAVSGTSGARYAKLGDSISAGQGLQPSTQAPTARLLSFLSAQGFPMSGSSVIANPRTTAADSRLTTTGTWTEFNPGIKTTMTGSTTVGDTKVFTATLTQAGNYTVRVMYSNASRPFTVSVDGGTAVTVTPAGGSAIASYTVALNGVTANTSHTVTVTTAGSSGTFYFASAHMEAAAGINVCNFGVAGSTSTDWYGGAQLYSALNHVIGWQPDLALIALMTNDANGNVVTPATYKTNMQAMITALLNANVDVVLEAQIPGDPNNVTLAPYREVVYDLADTNGIEVLDLYDRWGSFAIANGLGLMQDTFHPVAAGAADIGLAEAQLLAS